MLKQIDDMGKPTVRIIGLCMYLSHYTKIVYFVSAEKNYFSHKQWFPLKPTAGYFFVSYIFYIENFKMIKIKLNLLTHSVPITPVGMIKYLQQMAKTALF